MRLSAYLKTGTIIAGLAVTAAAQPAWAQSEAPPAEPEASAVADIVVTGSRIRRPNVEASTPVNVVDAQEIENIGVTNLIDAMARQPQVGLGASASSTTNTVAGQGLATLNLRNLGASRTLVLVNGRRHVAGSSGTSAVDVNTISKTTIARVDTVTGGSSAVYGADAVAGVVNFITSRTSTASPSSRSMVRPTARTPTTVRWPSDGTSTTVAPTSWPPPPMTRQRDCTGTSATTP